MVRYGGNTPCIEVTSSDGHTFILDMGSGAVDLGSDLIQRMKRQDSDSGVKKMGGTVLITHTHWVSLTTH
jgi:phosphoribosyl 1,2-cyclic phosphodiesterase